MPRSPSAFLLFSYIFKLRLLKTENVLKFYATILLLTYIEMQIHYGVENIQIKNPVVTIGSFDGVHLGHIQVIKCLKQKAQELEGESVIISFEPHPREVLYPLEKRPGILTTLDEKIEILNRYRVDHLIVLKFTRDLAELPYIDFVKQVLVDKIGIKGLVVGYDHHFGKGREGNFDTLCVLADKYHFELEREQVFETRETKISSTKIRTALELGDVELVKEFLGYNYSLSGKVVSGDRIGREIGFPTANIQLDDERKLLPASGVYGVKVFVGANKYYGMLNVGIRPTVCNSGILRIEVHIFDFHQNIYNETIQVGLLFRIRGEQRFENVEELKNQLVKDREEVLKRLNA